MDSEIPYDQSSNPKLYEDSSSDIPTNSEANEILPKVEHSMLENPPNEELAKAENQRHEGIVNTELDNLSDEENSSSENRRNANISPLENEEYQPAKEDFKNVEDPSYEEIDAKESLSDDDIPLSEDHPNLESPPSANHSDENLPKKKKKSKKPKKPKAEIPTFEGLRPVCDICGKSFSNVATLVKHKTIHENIRKFKCEHCARSFLRKAALRLHGYTHTGEKPFCCDVCGRGFADKSHFKKHKLIHTGIIYLFLIACICLLNTCYL